MTDKTYKSGKNKPIINIAETKYGVLPHVTKKLLNWKTSRTDDENWDVWWTDGQVHSDKLAKMRPYQKINHFPGMYALARKNHLGRNLTKMKKLFPKDYNFFPKTWLLPGDIKAFKE